MVGTQFPFARLHKVVGRLPTVPAGVALATISIVCHWLRQCNTPTVSNAPSQQVAPRAPLWPRRVGGDLNASHQNTLARNAVRVAIIEVGVHEQGRVVVHCHHFGVAACVPGTSRDRGNARSNRWSPNLSLWVHRGTDHMIPGASRRAIRGQRHSVAQGQQLRPLAERDEKPELAKLSGVSGWESPGSHPKRRRVGRPQGWSVLETAVPVLVSRKGNPFFSATSSS